MQSSSIESKKKIIDLNEALRRAKLINFPAYRQIGLLAEIHQLCVANKKTEPEPPEVAYLITGVDKVIKTVF